MKAERTLNDRVDEIHCVLCEEESYLAYLSATHNDQAVEGSLAADNSMAAKMIRDRAKLTGDSKIANEKIATIVKALGVVLRRYGASRKERCRQDGTGGEDETI